MKYIPILIQEYIECEQALKEAEKLLDSGSPDANAISRLEMILSADTDAMAMIRMHREYGQKLPVILERLTEKKIRARIPWHSDQGVRNNCVDEPARMQREEPKKKIITKEQSEFHNFWIEPKPDYYLLSNLPVANKCYNVLLWNRLLDTGNEHTREEWHSMEEMYTWRLPDVKLFHAVMRAAYHGSKSNNLDLKRHSMELKDMLMNDLKAYPLMTTTGIDTSMGQVISIKGISFDKSGKQVYAWDGALNINSKQKGLMLNGDDYHNAMQKLLKADFNEAKKVYRVDNGKDGFNLFGIPTEIGLTLPETFGIVTLRYERATYEGRPYIFFLINGNNPKDRKARARGFRVFDVQ